MKATEFPDMNRQGLHGAGKKIPLICAIIFILFMFYGCATEKVVYRPLTLPKTLQATPEVSEKARVAEPPAY
ncbi:MAG: hypothetical protein ACOYOS_14855, partial [Syntrophales bacterium]